MWCGCFQPSPVLKEPAEDSGQPGAPSVARSSATARTSQDTGISASLSEALLTKDPLLELSGCRYKSLRKINTGSFGFVQLAEDVLTKEKVAIKYLPRGSALRGVEREVLNLRACSPCPHIIAFRQVFVTRRYLAIVTDYAPLGDLADHLDHLRQNGLRPPGIGLPVSQARTVLQQLMLALHFCHSKGIANRDLKLENLLLTDSQDSSFPEGSCIKLCDFGFSKDERNESACNTACGTSEYVAPEVLTSRTYDGKAADVWSAGILLYCLLTGAYPYQEPGDEELSAMQKMQAVYPRILKAAFLRPAWMPPACIDLLQRMMEVNPALRITVQGIMQHPFFREGLPAGALEHSQRLIGMADVLVASYATQSEAGISAICARACRESSQYAPRSSFSSQNGHADILRSGGHERPRASAENERYNQAAAGQAPLPGRLSAVPKRRQADPTSLRGTHPVQAQHGGAAKHHASKPPEQRISLTAVTQNKPWQRVHLDRRSGASSTPDPSYHGDHSYCGGNASGKLPHSKRSWLQVHRQDAPVPDQTERWLASLPSEGSASHRRSSKEALSRTSPAAAGPKSRMPAADGGPAQSHRTAAQARRAAFSRVPVQGFTHELYGEA